VADPIPPGQPSGWPSWLWLLYLAIIGWFGDWLRSRWQNRRPPPNEHPHRRWDDDCPDCDEEHTRHHHHRSSDEDEEG
jgi:hypothetical protein